MRNPSRHAPFGNRKLAYSLLLMSCLALSGGRCIDGDSDKEGSNSSNDRTNNDLIEVSSEQKISADEGGFTGDLSNRDAFGSAIGDLGDLEADGVTDLAVGAPGDDDGGSGRGAVWVLFMNSNGRVDINTKISDRRGGFLGRLRDNDHFGSAVAGTGDLNSDGVNDLAVGAPGNNENKTGQGAVWLLFLDAQGRVNQHRKISENSGGFFGKLDSGDHFGSAVTRIGDVNGDGVSDLAVGAPDTDEGANNAGAVWILFMSADGLRVESWRKIANDSGGLGNKLKADDRFGAAVAGIGDLDGDGTPDLAVGVPGFDDGSNNQGAVRILFLDSLGRVRDQQKISSGSGGFDGKLEADDGFGSAVANVGDLDNDGTPDLAVGIPNDNDGSTAAGAVWVLLMEATGRVRESQKISANKGGFDGNLKTDDHFGSAVAGIGDLDGNGTPDMSVGAPGDNDGGSDKGAAWVLFLRNRRLPVVP